MAPTAWPQRIVHFADWDQAERTVATHLLPILDADENGPLEWSYVRKFPTWRLRYRPDSTETAVGCLDRALDRLAASGVVTSWTYGWYEPEETAFGGAAAMKAAHALFHADSRYVLHHVARRCAGTPDPLGPREIAILAVSAALRGAGLDWYEQGDVWARVAETRDGGTATTPKLRQAVRRLMTVDTSPAGQAIRSGRLAFLSDWVAAHHTLGAQLANLDRQGALGRGLRAVLAHHVLFHLNRLGLPRADQHTLSQLAKETVMGTSDKTPSTTPPADTVTGVNSTTTHDTEADRLRQQLVDELLADGSLRSPHIEQVMREVPRHLFVPDAPLTKAYGNTPVSIKNDPAGASISCASQPNVVAMMLEQLDVQPGENILELGAGTGYNAGLLGRLVGKNGHVTTIDVDEDLVEGARRGLASAGIDNAEVILGDGAVGHTANAPYDRIEATVGAHGVPQAWLDQLALGGRLVTPLRLRGSVSRSIAFEQDQSGAWRSISSEMNTFMPLRQGVADDPRVFVDLTNDGAVTLVTNGDQTTDPDLLAGVLQRARTEVWTGVTMRGQESGEWLELWLTCALPNGLSRMPVTREAVDNGIVTWPYASSTATFEGGSLAYLCRRLADHKAPDGANLYEFGVIGHGPDAKNLADQMAEQTRTWDREYRGHDVRFEIHPLDTEQPTPSPGRYSIDNGLNRLIVEWQ